MQRTCPKCKCPNGPQKAHCSEVSAAKGSCLQQAPATTAELCCTCIPSEEELKLKRGKEGRRPAAYNVAALALQHHLAPSWQELTSEGETPQEEQQDKSDEQPAPSAQEPEGSQPAADEQPSAGKMSTSRPPWRSGAAARRKATHDAASAAIREYLAPISAVESPLPGCNAEGCCACEAESSGSTPCLCSPVERRCCRCGPESVARRQAQRRARQQEAADSAVCQPEASTETGECGS